jgi:hypothetical protein
MDNEQCTMNNWNGKWKIENGKDQGEGRSGIAIHRGPLISVL